MVARALIERPMIVDSLWTQTRKKIIQPLHKQLHVSGENYWEQGLGLHLLGGSSISTVLLRRCCRVITEPTHDFWHFALLGTRCDSIAVKTFFGFLSPLSRVMRYTSVEQCFYADFKTSPGILNSLSWSFCRPSTAGCFSKRMKLCQVRTQFVFLSNCYIMYRLQSSFQARECSTLPFLCHSRSGIFGKHSYRTLCFVHRAQCSSVAVTWLSISVLIKYVCFSSSASANSSG